ncbi:hypothetical protein V6N12_044919 [Hibiscus sabdariffa]|uniref:Uncharacterized protein n=1 Tax=Hibiscus sabdariffa TaxID=183260 RepID=A0ABR2G1Y6_9ROSI
MLASLEGACEGDMGQQKLDWEREEHMDGVGERHMPVKKIWSVALEEVIACETMLRHLAKTAGMISLLCYRFFDPPDKVISLFYIEGVQVSTHVASSLRRNPVPLGTS